MLKRKWVIAFLVTVGIALGLGSYFHREKVESTRRQLLSSFKMQDLTGVWTRCDAGKISSVRSIYTFSKEGTLDIRREYHSNNTACTGTNPISYGPSGKFSISSEIAENGAKQVELLEKSGERLVNYLHLDGDRLLVSNLDWKSEETSKEQPAFELHRDAVVTSSAAAVRAD